METLLDRSKNKHDDGDDLLIHLYPMDKEGEFYVSLCRRRKKKEFDDKHKNHQQNCNVCQELSKTYKGNDGD